MEKAAEAFRTISEVSEELDVPQHVLRFWETRFAQVKPMKRAGGRRYYRPTDIDLLKGIRRLLYGEGYTIKGVQRILKEEGVAYCGSIGRGETMPKKREPDEVVPPLAKTPLKIGRPSPPPPGKAPLARPPARGKAGEADMTPITIHKLSDLQVSNLTAALAELGDARSLLGAKGP